MPIYEFECRECGNRYEELVAAAAAAPACPECGAEGARRLMSPVSPPGRQPRGHKVRSDESRRREIESGHQERLAKDKATRAEGKTPERANRTKGEIL